MQILPSNSTDTSMGFFLTGSDPSGFAEAMESALDSVSQGDAYSASTALDDDDANRPLVENPYTRNTFDGVTYTLSEVCFTKNELAELRESLLREGAPVESLKQFDILCEQPDGATLAQVMASLMGKSGSVALSEEDEQTIVGFLKQIDPTGDLSTDALWLMQNGQGQQALELISAKFAELGDSVDIDADQLMALGRGLGANQDTLRQLAESFGGFSSLTLNAAQFDKLMGPANNQFMTEAANREKLDAALEKTLKPLISKARNRMEQEAEAASLESRRIQLARLQIDNTVQKNSRETMNETLDGEQPNPESNAFANGPKLQNSENSLNAQMDQNSRNMAANVAQPRETGFKDLDQQFTGQDFSGQNRENPSKENAWQDLLGKVETKPAMQGPNTANTANSIVYSMLQGANAQASPLEGAMPQDAQFNQQMSRQMAAQVEQGLLTAMRDGATRMDLQLHPAELGTVAITLIARNGEVSAQIRSEKGETAEMLTRQLDAIRASLEQQGIKVDKLEVAMQNQNENSDGMAWQDLSDHNARQEEQARREEFARMRNLAALRNRDGAISNTLERSLHTIGETARYAGSAISVMA